MVEGETHLLIPLQPLLNEFNCTICFSEIDDSYITPCGHSFCKPCIEECLNRKHECPQCKQECLFNQCIKNFHLDSIVKKTLMLQEQANKEHYDQLLVNLVKNNSVEKQNPIETVFQLNMQECLEKFAFFYENAKKQKDQTILKTIKDYKDKLDLAFQQGEFQNRQALEDELQLKKQQIEQMFQKQVDLLVLSYDNHMKKMAPPPEAMPVQITILVPDRHVQIQHQAYYTDPINKIYQKIRDHFLNNANPIKQIKGN